MAFLEFNGIKIAGLSAAVPSSTEECVNIYKKWGGVRTLPFNHRYRTPSEI